MKEAVDLRRKREARLREELEGLERALEGFGDPDTAARPGLQLMGDAVRTKYEDVRQKFERSDTLALEMEIEGEPVEDGMVDGLLVAGLMSTLVALARELGVAVAANSDPAPSEAQLDAVLALRFDGGIEDGTGVRLVGPPRSIRQLALGPGEEQSLLETALCRLLALADEPGASELDDVRALLRDAAARATLTLYRPFDDPLTAGLDGTRAG